MELKRVVDLYLGEQIPTTAESYKYPLRQLIAWIGGAKAISDVDGFRRRLAL